MPGKIFGAILLVGVAGFGINNVILDFGNNTVARVGDQEITVRAFQRAYSSELNRLAMQFGIVPTAEEAMNMGLPMSVIQRLSQDAALDGLASDFGLGVTEAKLGQLVREDPSFSGTLGTFNAESFAQVLRMSGLTEAEYFAMQTRAASREQLVVSLFGDTELPDTAADLLSRYINDMRTLEYVVINELGVPTPEEPSEAELASYLEDNQTAFRTVEVRQVDVLSLSLQSLAEGIEIAEEQVAAEYERVRESLSTPERRTLEQVVLGTEQQVALFEAGLAEGRGFAELAAEAGLRPTVLADRARSDINDANLANAAFSLEEGDFAIIPGVAGRRAIHLASVTPAGETPFEAARAEIEQRLAQAEARSEYMEVLDQVEELRASFQPLTGIAERFGLDLHRIEVTASGTELEAVADLPADSRQRVTQAIFAARPDGLSPAVALASNHHVFVDLIEIEPMRDQTLDEVRDEVFAAIMRERTDAAIAAQADEVVARLANGEALADVAFAYNQFAQVSSPFDRGGEMGTPIDQTVASVAFAGGPGHHGTALNESGERVVFQVVDVMPATEGLAEPTRQALAEEIQIALYGDFVAAVRDSAGLRINQRALEQVLATNTAQ